MKIYFYVGLPRSGKTTLAKEYRNDNEIIVDCDKIRAMLVAGDPASSYKKENEPIVWATFNALVKSAISNQKNVHIVNTNCNLPLLKKLLEELKKFNAQQNRANDTEFDLDFYWIIVDTPVEVCKQRALDNGQYTLLPVIENMKTGFKEVVEEIEKSFHHYYIIKVGGSECKN